MLPNFLLIGEAKAGTTSIHQYLRQHPQIFMSRFKEPGYFTFEGTSGYFPRFMDQKFITTLSEYESLFKGASDYDIVGESSSYYLDFASEDVVSRIKSLLPSVKIMAVLRQPVDQAYSRYIMWEKLGRKPNLTFEEKYMYDMDMFHNLEYDFHAEEFVTKSYYDRLKLFTDLFPSKDVKVMLYDDLISDGVSFMKEIFHFLEIDERFSPETGRKSNQGGVFRSPFISGIFNRPNPIRWLSRKTFPDEFRKDVRDILVHTVTKPAPKLDPGTRKRLTHSVHEEISNLEKLIGRDLTIWRC